MPNLISLAPPKSTIELNNYLNWLQEFSVKILKEGDDVEGLLILCGGPDIGVNQERDVLEFKWLQEALDKNIRYHITLCFTGILASP